MYNRCILIHRNNDAMSWRLFFFVLATSTLIAWPTSATPPATQVLMDSGSPYYVPAAVTVTAGGAIRWENPTPTLHTVTHDACFEDSGRCAFDSGAVEPGEFIRSLASRPAVIPTNAVFIPLCAA